MSKQLVHLPKARSLLSFASKVPFHSVGALITEQSNLDEWRRRGGLDWEAISSPVFTEIDGNQRLIHNRKVLFRSDTRKPLSVVNNRYRPVQPSQVIEFYRDLCDVNGYQMETAGSLRGGKTIWAMARVPMETLKVVIPEEEIRPYVLLSTSFDYSSATIVKLTAVRVVCQTSLNISFNENSTRMVSIPHSRIFDPKAVKIKLDLHGAMTRFTRDASELSRRGVSDEEAANFFLNVYKGTDIPNEKPSEDRLMARLMDLFRSGPGSALPTAFGTAWGLVNAVTQDVDHSTKSRSEDNRMSSAWFGPGERRKQLAYKTAKELVGIE